MKVAGATQKWRPSYLFRQAENSIAKNRWKWQVLPKSVVHRTYLSKQKKVRVAPPPLCLERCQDRTDKCIDLSTRWDVKKQSISEVETLKIISKLILFENSIITFSWPERICPFLDHTVQKKNLYKHFYKQCFLRPRLKCCLPKFKFPKISLDLCFRIGQFQASVSYKSVSYKGKPVYLIWTRILYFSTPPLNSAPPLL